MSKNKWDESGKLHPNNKYKGILYTRRQTEKDDDFFNSRPRRQSQNTGGYKPVGALWSPAEPPRRQRGGRSSARAAENIRAARPRNPYEKSSRTEDLSKRISSFFGSTGDMFRGFFSDLFVRRTALICAVILGVSAIAIPTAFARPTTDIVLNDGGRVMQAPTAAKTVREFLDDNKVVLGPDDFLETDPNAPITDGLEIIIRRAMPVTVNTEAESLTVNMVAGTVQDALDRAGVYPALQDEVYPSPDTFVRAGMRVDHIEVQVEQTEEEHDIPYETREEEDSSLAKGDTEIAQYGDEGTLKITSEQVYKNGKLTSDKVISEEVIEEPTTEIIKVGTYVPPPPKPKAKKVSDIHKGGGSSGGGSGSGGSGSSGGSDSGGGGGKYTVSVRVTAYCSACNTGNTTATGAYPSWGTVAANTGQFPFGTHLYIPGYGDGRVEDTGGFGSGTIDVYLGQRDVCNCAHEWPTGTYTITVY